MTLRVHYVSSVYITLIDVRELCETSNQFIGALHHAGLLL